MQTQLFNTKVRIKDMSFDQYNEMIKRQKANDYPNQAGLRILADMVNKGYNPLKNIKK